MRCERSVAAITGLVLVSAAPGALAHSFGAVGGGFGAGVRDGFSRGFGSIRHCCGDSCDGGGCGNGFHDSLDTGFCSSFSV